MKNKWYCSPLQSMREIKPASRLLQIAIVFLLCVPGALAGDAPAWMHSLVNAPLPAHDEKTDAVLLYSETNVAVISTDKVRVVVREAYKILRPGGRDYGVASVFTNANRKVTGFRGWCIPAQGKDYEIKDKEAVEVAVPKIEGSDLISDVRYKLLRIPASDPGNIVGYEYEVEERPLVLQAGWEFQESVPVRESHYSLQLPPGWEYKASFLNYPETKATQSGNGQWQWAVSDVKAVKKEEDMPPMQGLLGQMIISFLPPSGQTANGFSNWSQMGNWYRGITAGRFDASPEIKQKVASLTASDPSRLSKIRTLAQFVQSDIRYVAIELGIGGWQPHSASEVFAHRYGDCKDKATLMAAMLHEIGVESYYVLINTNRGSVTPDTPANLAFDHVVLAIKVPEGVPETSLVAMLNHPKMGKILFFDPTNEYTPFGQIGGYLQANYGLLVTPDGGELLSLPKQSSALNSIQRVGALALDPSGKLQGEVHETRMGDRAWGVRATLRNVTNDQDRVKPIENVLSSSLSNFRLTKANVVNLMQSDQPFGFNYSFEADGYAKTAGNLLLLRPRVLGSKSRGILETKEPRKFPIEFEGPVKDVDQFEITIPAGYEVEELPPPVDADFGFASYHSKTVAKGNVVGYTRTFEVNDLSVPVAKAEELKKFYRIIANDERSTAVLRPTK
jgi:uncharacterized protein DUF3857/transglutaminase superfamily protein